MWLHFLILFEKGSQSRSHQAKTYKDIITEPQLHSGLPYSFVSIQTLFWKCILMLLLIAG